MPQGSDDDLRRGLQLKGVQPLPGAAGAVTLAPGVPPQPPVPDVGGYVGQPFVPQSDTVIGRSQKAVKGVVPPDVPRMQAPIKAAYDAVVSDLEGTGVNPKSGAINGLMPGTAKELGVDPDDPKQAAAGRSRYLQQMYDKYGDWPDALAAFNWGPGNLDDWIKKGRKMSAMPAETRNYVATAMMRVGHGAPEPQGADAQLSGKRQGTMEDLLGSLAADKTGEDHVDVEEPKSISEALAPAAELGIDPSGFYTPEFGEQSAALQAGAVRSLIHLPAGVVEEGMRFTGAERSDEWIANWRRQVGDLEDRLGISEMARRQPLFEMMGEAIGTAAAIYAGGKALGSVEALQFIPAWLRSAGAGGLIGLTTFHPEDVTDAWRYFETALTTAAGGIGHSIAVGTEWSVKYLASRSALNTFVKTLQQSVGDLNDASSRVGRSLREWFGIKYEQAQAKYGVSKTTGETFRGFEAGGLEDAVRSATTPGTRSTAAGVMDRLGMGGRTRRAADDAMKDYTADLKRWERDNARALRGVNFDQLSQGAKEQVLSQLPARPEPPLTAGAPPVAASKFAEANKFVNEQIDKASTANAKRELRDMKAALWKAAQDVAAEYEMSGEAFVRSQEAADKFFAENVGPIRDWLSGASGVKTRQITPKELERRWNKFSDTKLTDYVLKAIDSNDKEQMAAMGKAMSPHVKREAQKLVEWNMLQELGADQGGVVPAGKIPHISNNRGEQIARVGKYIADRKEGLIEMLGRDRVAELEGEAHIAQQLMQTEYERYKHIWTWGTRSVLPVIGAERFFENVFKGRPGEGLVEGVGLVAAPYAAHALFKTFQMTKALPYLVPGVRAAAQLRPGSPELDKLVRQLQNRIVSSSVGLARATTGAAQSMPQ